MSTSIETMEPEPRDVVALLRAHLAGDTAAIEMLLNVVDVRGLFAMTVGALCQVFEEVGITPEHLDAELRRWQIKLLE